jgi:hypothetical protein
MHRTRRVPDRAMRPAAWLVVLFLTASHLAGAANGPAGGALPVVTNLNGVVSVIGRDGVPRDVLSTRLIHSGDKILTGVGSLALVNLADVGGVHLGPATTAVASTTGKSLLVSLLSGSVCAEALTAGVSVAAGSLTLTPTQPDSVFSILRSTAATTVVVYQGAITVGSQDQAGQPPSPVTLLAGQAARSAGAGALGPVAIADVQPLFSALQCPSPDVIARVLPTPTPAPQAHGGGAGGIIGALLGIGALVALAGSHGGGNSNTVPPPTAPPTPVPGPLSVSPASLSFDVGGSPQSFTASEANYSGPINATSGNTTVATVSPASGNGPGPVTFTVTPVAPGNTTITVSDNHDNTQNVSISIAAPGAITVNPSSLTFLAGGTPQTFTADEPGYAGVLAAHSNNTGVATVAGGGNGPGPVTFTVTPVGSGTTTITVTGGAPPATVNVTVIGPLTTSTGSLSFLGTTTPQTFTATDPLYTGPLTASTSDPGVATVSGGGNGPGPVTFTVTPVGEGNATITVSDTFGGSAVVNVSVSTGGLLVNPTSLTILAGQAAPFTASEANYHGKILAASSNPNLATVSPPSQNGPGPVTFRVNALAAGDLSIGVSSSDQPTVFVSVTITGPMTVTPGSLTFNGTTAPQTLSVNDPNYFGSITASSSNISVATVNSPQTGPTATFTVTPVGAGTATITFQDANLGTTSALVSVAYGPLTVTPSSIGLVVGGPTGQVTASETFYTGPIAASSANASLATVTPASANGPGPVTFTITGQGPGNTTIQVSDNHGGSQQVAVGVSGPPVLNPTSLTFTDVGPSSAQTVTINQPGYTGTFSVVNNSCSNVALVGTPSGNGPTASLSVEGNPGTLGGGTCQFAVAGEAGVSSSPVNVTVGPFGAVTPTPASLTFTDVGAGAAQTFTVAESGYTGVFTVSANACAGVATVSPQSGTSATTFTVTPVAAGGPCDLVVADDHGQSANVTVTVGPFGSLTVNPSSLSLAVGGASQSFTASETGYSGTISVDQKSCATNNVASVSPTSGTSGTQFTVSPGANAGNCKVVVTDDHGGTANVLVFVSAGSLTVSPQTIQFAAPSSSPVPFTVNDTNPSATTFTANSQNTNVAAVSPSSQPGPAPVTFTVTPTGNGQTSIIVSDGVGGQAVVSIGVGVPPLVVKRRPVHLHTGLPVVPRQRLPAPRQPSTGPGTSPGAGKYPGAPPSSGSPAGSPGAGAAAISVSVSGISLQAGTEGASFVITEPGYAGRFYLNISDPGVARIDPLVASGPAATLTVTGLRPGSAVVRITDDAGHTRPVTIFVRPAQAVRPGLGKPGKPTS